MNLTDLRRSGVLPARSHAPGGSEVRTERLEEWLREFSRLHQVGVHVLNQSGETVLGPYHEPGFCVAAKSSLPEGCPADCGRSNAKFPDAPTPCLYRCPYHLSMVSWVARGRGGRPWTIVLGRTLATQDQLTQCLERVQGSEALEDATLSSLGSIPWQAEPQLAVVAKFLQTSLSLILEQGGEETAPRESRDFQGSARREDKEQDRSGADTGR